jgi:NAD(P)-dependent dehydrogenase (short-subunit alcohol dehydrogenase family)
VLFGTATADVAELARRLEADHVIVDTNTDAALEAWRTTQVAAPRRERIIVAVWPAAVTPTRFDAAQAAETATAAEDQIVAWVAALGAAKARCADGGAIVAACDRPAPLDAGGHTVTAAVADAVEALVRSLARSEGPRGVRVNAVTSPARTTTVPVVDPAPPLARFPGDAVADSVAVIDWLLDPRAQAVTGQVVHADSGRSWR